MTKMLVSCIRPVLTSVEVDAESARDAVRLAREHLDGGSCDNGCHPGEEVASGWEPVHVLKSNGDDYPQEQWTVVASVDDDDPDQVLQYRDEDGES